MVITHIKSSPSRRKVLLDIDGAQHWYELETLTKPLDGTENDQLAYLLLRLRLAGRGIVAAELLVRNRLDIGTL